MKTIFLSLFVYLLFPTMTMARPFYPPKNLNWGMSQEEVSEELSASLDKKRVELKKLSKGNKKKHFFPDSMLPSDHRAAELKNVKVLGENARYAFAVFDKGTELVAIQYQFTVVNLEGEYRDFWSFFKKLDKGLTVKYGEPSFTSLPESAIDRRMSADNMYHLWWTQDDSGEFIRMIIYVNNIVVANLNMQKYLLILEYGSSAWYNTIEAKLEQNELMEEDEIRSSDDF